MKDICTRRRAMSASPSMCAPKNGCRGGMPGGTQPMTVPTPAGDVAMVYSGEAYNFRELREELT